MNSKQVIRLSKFLSLVLRHKPETIGLHLDEAGWVSVSDLLSAMKQHGHPLLLDELQQLVAGSDKQRFAFSDDGVSIRASQGHSVEVELGYEPAAPPDRLYHGTVDRFLESIRQKGLIKGDRHHVHLSADIATADKVGQRRGRAIVLNIDSARMQADGLQFFVSANGVWLTEHVPGHYIQFPEHSGWER